jgi:3-oxoacyl-[acyl-carrier-protein] synthase II
VGAEALDGEHSGVEPVRRFAAPAPGFAAGLVPDIDPRSVDRRLDLRGFDLCSCYTALAARTALDGAGIKPRPAAAAKMGMVLGIATGPGQGEAEHLRATFEGGFELSSVGAFPYVVPNEAAGNVARALMLKGHSTVLAAGPGAGLAALISAAVAVEQGHGETILAAAADELTERSAADGYALGLWGPGTGVIPGEGAAALVVESEESATGRGAPILAEVLGCAMTTDPADPGTGDRLAALARALELAVERAGVDLREVDLVVTGGAGSDGISAEKLAVERVFRSQLQPFSLAGRIGYAEAALPLINLGYQLVRTEPGKVLAAAFAGPEGFASALILRAGSG